MATHYTTKHVMELFSVSHETVKNWTAEFADFLSATATPPAGTKRVFTDLDLSIFALVADYKKRGLTYSDAHIALKTGQRGEIPATSAMDRLPAVVQDLVVTLRVELDTLRTQLDEERAKTNKAVGQVELLRMQLEEKEKYIRDLLREVARYEAQNGQQKD